jgi:hypothetical protein
LAFEANFATFPPALPIAPFEELLVRDRDAVLERELEGFDEPLRPRVLDELLRPRVLDELLRTRVLPERELLLFDLVEEPFRLVDFFELEPLRFVRPLEDRVVWAIVLASLSLLASVPAAPFAAAVHLDLPAVQRI